MIANGRNLIFDLAVRRVSRYAASPDRARQSVDEALACEQAIIDGLDAIRWIRRADETMRAADYEGMCEYTEDLQGSMKSLLDDWMRKAISVETSVGELQASGAVIPGSKAFSDALKDVQEQIASRELTWHKGSSAFQDEPW